MSNPQLDSSCFAPHFVERGGGVEALPTDASSDRVPLNQKIRVEFLMILETFRMSLSYLTSFVFILSLIIEERFCHILPFLTVFLLMSHLQKSMDHLLLLFPSPGF